MSALLGERDPTSACRIPPHMHYVSHAERALTSDLILKTFYYTPVRHKKHISTMAFDDMNKKLTPGVRSKPHM
jgi:hypothetical protein